MLIKPLTKTISTLALSLIVSNPSNGKDNTHLYSETCKTTIEVPSSISTNTFYEWELKFQPKSCGNGSLEVKGYMPAHAHGLPSIPVIVEDSDGRYFIKGIYFNMMGRWILSIYNENKVIDKHDINVIKF
ncbi:hypothetical protein ACET89_04185 [Aeromonas veronii]